LDQRRLSNGIIFVGREEDKGRCMAEKVERERVGEETVARIAAAEEEETGDMFLNLAGNEGVDLANDC
jgi:hypothetical protein